MQETEEDSEEIALVADAEDSDPEVAVVGEKIPTNGAPPCNSSFTLKKQTSELRESKKNKQWFHEKLCGCVKKLFSMRKTISDVIKGILLNYETNPVNISLSHCRLLLFLFVWGILSRVKNYFVIYWNQFFKDFNLNDWTMEWINYPFNDKIS